MRRTFAYFLLAALSFVAASASVWGQERKDSLVTLVSAKSAQLIERDGQSFRKVTGPARFLHNNTYLLCDSALWNVTTNIIDAVGHVQIIQDLKEGEISEPVESTDNEGYQQGRPGNTVYKIIRVDKIVPAHPASFTNDYTDLQSRVRMQRQMQAIDEFLEQRIKDTYIVIDPMYKDCSFDREIWRTKF